MTIAFPLDVVKAASVPLFGVGLAGVGVGLAGGRFFIKDGTYLGCIIF
jgi:hypothetical protein